MFEISFEVLPQYRSILGIMHRVVRVETVSGDASITGPTDTRNMTEVVIGVGLLHLVLTHYSKPIPKDEGDV